MKHSCHNQNVFFFCHNDNNLSWVSFLFVFVCVAWSGESTSRQNATPPSVRLAETTLRNQWELGVHNEQARQAVLDVLRKIFPTEASNLHLHNYYTCVEKNCIKLSDANWKSDISDAVKNSHEVTCTEWCLTRLMKLQTSYSLVFPALVHIAEVCLSMPVSNAWPEHGCSAPKSVKTRLRSRLSVEMLQTLLAITINGPNVGTLECESLMTSAVDLWESQKKRRPRCTRHSSKWLGSKTPCSYSKYQYCYWCSYTDWWARAKKPKRCN